ncbi:MAG TPA: hypothetical protein VG273_01165 [Bryobacteraceae bacterium]|jgi:hypothetical protein|nr:hypothetical protein [Bryobacteraceae bacterium]
MNAEFQGTRSCLANALLRWIKARYIPATLGKEEGVSPLAHADVQRFTGASTGDGIDQKSGRFE